MGANGERGRKGRAYTHRNVSWKIIFKNLISTWQRMNLNPDQIPHSKFKYRQIHGLHVRLTTTKLSEKNIRPRPRDIGFSNNILVMTSKTQAIK